MDTFTLIKYNFKKDIIGKDNAPEYIENDNAKMQPVESDQLKNNASYQLV